MSQWHIGQKVVCVKPHSQGVVVVGSTYTIGAIHECSCGATSFDVGVRTDCLIMDCTRCGFTEFTGGIGWLSSSRFRPLAEADLSAELAETFLKGQPPSEQEVYNPQHA